MCEVDTEILSKIITKKLESNCDQLTSQFFSINSNTSTKFFILDDLLPNKITLDIYKHFPNIENYDFVAQFNKQKKFTFTNLAALESPIVENIINALQMENVIKALERITKIQHLESDESLYAGGISRMDLGHFLNPHIDNSHNSNRKKYRRLNILYYVTPETYESDGGNFELWDKKVKKPFKIPSKFNRLIVMETTKYSWHSVDPVFSNIKRCCVSSYLYTQKSSEKYEYYHVTSFLSRPDEKLKRAYGVMDNLLRNIFVKITGFSRGKKLMRITKKK